MKIISLNKTMISNTAKETLLIPEKTIKLGCPVERLLPQHNYQTCRDLVTEEATGVQRSHCHMLNTTLRRFCVIVQYSARSSYQKMGIAGSERDGRGLHFCFQVLSALRFKVLRFQRCYFPNLSCEILLIFYYFEPVCRFFFNV